MGTSRAIAGTVSGVLSSVTTATAAETESVARAAAV